MVRFLKAVGTAVLVGLLGPMGSAVAAERSAAQILTRSGCGPDARIDRARQRGTGIRQKVEQAMIAGRGPSRCPDHSSCSEPTPTTPICRRSCTSDGGASAASVRMQAGLDRRSTTCWRGPQRAAQGRGAFRPGPGRPVQEPSRPGNLDLAGVEEFLKNDPKDPRGRIAALHRRPS